MRGKINCLPEEIRDELNSRLYQGQTGRQLTAWLNSLPKVRESLAAEFGSRPINEPNLSAWRRNEYQKWLARHQALTEVKKLPPPANGNHGKWTEDLTAALAMRYAALMMKWNGEVTDEYRTKFQMFHELCHSVLTLRRGDLIGDHLDIARLREGLKGEQLAELKRTKEN